MKYLIAVCFLLSTNLFARQNLNFIEAHQLRLSAHESAEEWMVPFHYHTKPGNLDSFIFVSGKQEVLDLFNTLQSRDRDKITSLLNNSYGVPYDASAKVGFLYKFHEWSQHFSINGGAALIVNDPVFPELRGLIFQDYTGTTAYMLRSDNKKFSFKPRLVYGYRRLIFGQYTTGDLLNNSLNTKINKTTPHFFTEFSFQSAYQLPFFQLLAEGNSLPLTGANYNYWDTFLGARTLNLSKYLGRSIKTLTFYGGYSPFYGGYYDASRTIKIGTQVAINEHFAFDFFSFDKFLPGARLSFSYDWFELSLHTFERAYDDYLKQISRQYGLNLKASF